MEFQNCSICFRRLEKLVADDVVEIPCGHEICFRCYCALSLGNTSRCLKCGESIPDYFICVLKGWPYEECYSCEAVVRDSDDEQEIVFFPCNHTLCEDCADENEEKGGTCPQCRSEGKLSKTYYRLNELTRERNFKDDVIKKDPENFKFRNGKWFLAVSNWSTTYRYYVQKQERREQILDIILNNKDLNSWSKRQAELKEWFWWPTWKKDLDKAINGARLCSKVEVRAPSPVENKKWEVVNADIIGPLEASSRDNIHVVLLEDQWSKFLVATALPRARAKDVADWLAQTFYVFGLPRVIRCSEKTQFRGSKFHEFGLKFKIQLFYPEAMPRHQIEALILTEADEDEEWDKTLEKLVFQYNTKEFSAGVSPFRAFFDRAPIVN